ncbi:MAG: cytochrome c oxidase subunit II transmembrane domain-containing protein [Hyphococcus sp.]
MTKRLLATVSGLGALAAGAAHALPTPGGITMQPANSSVAEEVHFFHNVVLMPIITAISLFVLGLLLYVMLRYNSRANPNPRKFSHNTLVEVIWTGVPIMILLVIALFSFDLLYKEDVVPDGQQVVVQGDGQTVDFVFANDFADSRMVTRGKHLQVFVDNGSEVRKLQRRADYALDGLGDSEVVVSFDAPPARGERVIIRGGRSLDRRGDVVLGPTMTLKVNGYQWGWTYSYPDFGDFEYSSNMLPDEEVADPYLRKFEVDNRVVVPVGETIRVTTTAQDVIHSWALPAFALKIDAVPGRINETWFKADREGVVYGQCSEICGVRHSFMPIAVEVVSRAEFERWVDGQRALAGLDPMFDGDAVKLAQAENAAAAAE